MRGDKTSKGRTICKDKEAGKKRDIYTCIPWSLVCLGHRQDLRAGLAQEGVV